MYCAVLALGLSSCGRTEPLSQSGEPGGGDKTDAHVGKPSCAFQGFANPVAYTPSSYPHALVSTDLTGDGRLDYLCAGVTPLR